MKKIVFVISSLGSGGAERVVVNLANCFSNKNEVSIITLSNENSFYELDKKVKHIKLNLMRDSKNIFQSVKNNYYRFYKLRQVLKDKKPDILVSFLTQTNVISIISTIGFKFKKIVSEHSVYFSENNNFIWKILRRVTYPFADNVVLLTKADSKNYTFIKNKVVIPNFIEIKENRDVLKKENIMLAVGRLHPVKQFDKLIKLYFKSEIEWPLYIVGEGSERKKLKKLIKELNLENRVFLEGKKKNIYDYYKRAKIFLLTSKHEAFPNVLLEAMYFGCGIISFDCPYGPGEIIENNKSGFLVNNDDEFVEKLKLLVNNEEALNEISKNEKKNSKNFSKNLVFNKWKQVI